MPATDADHVEVPVSGANGVSESSSSPPSCISPNVAQRQLLTGWPSPAQSVLASS
jgi:hypothetical protein